MLQLYREVCWRVTASPCKGEAKVLAFLLILLWFVAIIFLVMHVDKKRNADLTKRAQKLRSHATEQENRLWYTFLRKYPVQFRRQVTMNQFIVDFFCAKAKLILELDGSQHYEEQGLAYDAERTAILESFGYKVLRFTNEEINHNFHNVCDAIDREVKARLNVPNQKK